MIEIADLFCFGPPGCSAWPLVSAAPLPKYLNESRIGYRARAFPSLAWLWPHRELPPLTEHKPPDRPSSLDGLDGGIAADTRDVHLDLRDKAR